MGNNIAFIKKIDVPKWHGKSSKDYKGPVTPHEAYIDPHTKKYVVVIDEARKKELIEKHGFTCLRELDWNPKGHPFYSDPINFVKLEDGTTMFNLDLPKDEVLFAIALGLPQVAPSEHELPNRPEAMYYVWSTAVAAKDKATIHQKKSRAYGAVASMSYNRKSEIIMALTKKGVGVMKPDEIDAEIEDLIVKQVDDFLVYATMSENDLRTRAAVVMAISLNEIYLRDNVYHWGDKRLGRDVEEVTIALGAPGNEDILQRVEERIKNSQMGIKEPASLKPKISRNDHKGNAVPVETKVGETGQPEETDVSV